MRAACAINTYLPSLCRAKAPGPLLTGMVPPCAARTTSPPSRPCSDSVRPPPHPHIRPKRHAPATRTPHRVGPPHAARQRLEWAAWTALNLGATLVTALLLRTLPGEDRTLFLLYYQPLIPALAMLWFWTVAVWHWERRGVRYAACFSPEDARHLPGSAVLFRAGTALSAVTTLSGAVFLYQLAEGQRGAAALQPPLMYSSLAVALLWPGPGFHGVRAAGMGVGVFVAVCPFPPLARLLQPPPSPPHPPRRHYTPQRTRAASSPGR